MLKKKKLTIQKKIGKYFVQVKKILYLIMFKQLKILMLSIIKFLSLFNSFQF